MYAHLGMGIERLYPGATHLRAPKAEVVQDADGQKVVMWDAQKLGPMPALDVIESAGIQYEADLEAEKAKPTAEQRIAALEEEIKAIKEKLK